MRHVDRMANMMSGASNQPGGTGPHGMSSLLQAYAFIS